MDTEEWNDAFAKPWTEMTKAEKRKAYDELLEACKAAAEELDRDLNEYLSKHTTMRVSVEIKLTPDPNDDPRLP